MDYQYHSAPNMNQLIFMIFEKCTRIKKKKKSRKSRQMSIQIMEMWTIFCEGEQAFHVILLSDRKY